MKKCLYTVLCLLFVSRAYAQADTLFDHVKFDTLHVYSTGTYGYTGKPLVSLPHTHAAFQKMNLDSGEYQPLCSFFMNEKNTLVGYLLREVTHADFHQVIHLCVYDTKQKKYIFHHEAASYLLLEGSTEQTANTWITDISGDGVMDICTKKEILDFELPNEESQNISGTELYMYIFKNGVYEYAYWDENILIKEFVKK